MVCFNKLRLKWGAYRVFAWLLELYDHEKEKSFQQEGFGTQIEDGVNLEVNVAWSFLVELFACSDVLDNAVKDEAEAEDDQVEDLNECCLVELALVSPCYFKDDPDCPELHDECEGSQDKNCSLAIYDQILAVCLFFLPLGMVGILYFVNAYEPACNKHSFRHYY